MCSLVPTAVTGPERKCRHKWNRGELCRGLDQLKREDSCLSDKEAQLNARASGRNSTFC